MFVGLESLPPNHPSAFSTLSAGRTVGLDLPLWPGGQTRPPTPALPHLHTEDRPPPHFTAGRPTELSSWPVFIPAFYLGSVRQQDPKTELPLPTCPSTTGDVPGAGGPYLLPLVPVRNVPLFICADGCLLSDSVSGCRCWTVGGRPILALISRLVQMERAHAQLLCLLSSLCPLYTESIGGRVVFLLFPPISLLVQPQKVPYHCRMSGHTLPSGLAM